MKITLRRRRVANAPQQVQDLRLHRYVQRRQGFVGDQQLAFHREGARDGHALLLAAAHLHWEARAELDRQSHFLQQIVDPLVDLVVGETISWIFSGSAIASRMALAGI